MAFLDFETFGKRLIALVETRRAFFEADLLADTLCAGLEALRTDRSLRGADFFAEVFFFLGLTIAWKTPFTKAPEKTEA